jgi:hypothetical protein
MEFASVASVLSIEGAGAVPTKGIRKEPSRRNDDPIRAPGTGTGITVASDGTTLHNTATTGSQVKRVSGGPTSSSHGTFDNYSWHQTGSNDVLSRMGLWRLLDSPDLEKGTTVTAAAQGHKHGSTSASTSGSGSITHHEWTSDLINRAHYQVHTLLKLTVWPMPMSEYRTNWERCWFLLVYFFYFLYIVTPVYLLIDLSLFFNDGGYIFLPGSVATALRVLSSIPLCLLIRRRVGSGPGMLFESTRNVLNLHGYCSNLSDSLRKTILFTVIEVAIFLPVVILVGLCTSYVRSWSGVALSTFNLSIMDAAALVAELFYYIGGAILTPTIVFFLVCDISVCRSIVEKCLEQAEAEVLVFDEYKRARDMIDETVRTNNVSLGILLGIAAVNILVLIAVIYLFPERSAIYGEKLSALAVTLLGLILSPELLLTAFLLPEIVQVNELAAQFSLGLSERPWKIKSNDEHRVNILLSYREKPIGYTVCGIRVTKLNLYLQVGGYLLSFLIASSRALAIDLVRS